MQQQSENTDLLNAAICQAMTEISAIKPTGWNEHSKYAYASDYDLTLAVQPIMAKHGLSLTPGEVFVDRETAISEKQASEGKTGTERVTVRVVYVLAHTSGQWRVAGSAGVGHDTLDKGVYKAMTGALKYIIRSLFMIPVGDDAEVETEKQKVIEFAAVRKDLVKRLNEGIAAHKFTPEATKKYMSETLEFEVESVAKISNDQLQKVVEKMEGKNV